MPTTEPAVQLIAWTHFQAPDDVPWSTDADGGSALVEFAGRACYQSWTKPNPATATNAGYIGNILEVGHFSVLEHGTATFYFTGVSRSFTHELIRHRHLCYSQMSQRYVEDAGDIVEPDAIANHPYLHSRFTEVLGQVHDAYREIVHVLDRQARTEAVAAALDGHVPFDMASGDQTRQVCAMCLTDYPCPPANASAGLARRAQTAARKTARQAARAILPNATETRIVVTGNYRAWRHFVDMRASEHADVEIRGIAVDVLRNLKQLAPAVFADYTIVPLPDGTLAATCKNPERS